MTKKFLSVLVATVLSLTGINAESTIIPQPAKVKFTSGQFELKQSTKLVSSNREKSVAKSLVAYLKPATGFKFNQKNGATNSIVLKLEKDSDLGAEGYTLSVKPTKIVITASQKAGLFYGCQTLRQLFPVEIFSDSIQKDIKWKVPCVEITDQPRFGWRGMMLDASRHFQSVDYVKKFIDRLAMHKLNTFHWHLVDGHGWRIEIKKYPRLTQIGAWRDQPPIGRYGGFYTQEEIKDVVKYAQDRFITVIPEIEMPGHSRAAISAYPELSCSGKQGPVDFFYEYPCAAQRFPACSTADVFCAGNEKTFEFLENVLLEVFELFPSKYIHVGGDEVNKSYWNGCPKCKKRMADEKLKDLHELQSYFMARMEKFVNKNKRRMIGWDEILEGGLAPNATVMSWRGTAGGIKSAQMGHDVVMTPGKPLYFDHGQSTHPSHPAHWPGVETLKEVYQYNPIPKELTKEQQKHILGAQANLWTVFIHTPELYDVQTFPRLMALAETTWTPLAEKNWDSYLIRQKTHLKRLDELNISYWIEPKPCKVWEWNPKTCSTTPLERKFSLNSKELVAGDYQLTFQYIKGALKLDIHKVALLKDGKIISEDIHVGHSGSNNKNNVYSLKVPKINNRSSYEITVTTSTENGTDSYGSISLNPLNGPSIFKETDPKQSSAIKPVTQNRDKTMYDWKERHQRAKKFVKATQPDVIFIGDSITHYWGGEPSNRYKCAPGVWNKHFGNLKTANLGFGWDRTENVLWRLCNGALASTKPKLVVLLIGTNNLDFNSDREIADGIEEICKEITKLSPNTKILLLGVLPRIGTYKTDLKRVNFLTSMLHNRNNVTYLNINYKLLDKDGMIDKQFFRDNVHPNGKGYEVIASEIEPVIRKMLEN